MHAPNLVILYVADVPASEAFYARLFDRTAVESSPGFAMFVLEGGLRLGLWRRDAVEPAAGAAAPGASELVFQVADGAALDRCHAQWQSMGLRIAQPPVAMEFGATFTALDPDGHRLRVYVPAG